jgi:hypothetical protein
MLDPSRASNQLKTDVASVPVTMCREIVRLQEQLDGMRQRVTTAALTVVHAETARR